MTFRRFAALAFGASLVGPAAHAQLSMPSVMGGTPYVTLEGGWNHTSTLEAQSSVTPSAPIGIHEGGGYIVGGALGWAFGPMRAELGFDYRYNGIRSVVAPPGTVTSGEANGDLESYAGMLRGYYDLPWSAWGITPYIGAGVGLVGVDLNNVVDGHTLLVNDSHTLAAVEGAAGLRYDLNASWSASLEYRFLNGFDPTFRAASGNRFSTTDYRNSSVLLKISYSFGAPPTPPPPMPAAAPAPVAPAPPAQAAPGPRQLFLVFFDFDKSSLTQAGQQVLDQAIAAFKQSQPVRIEVTGYTDTVGTQRYNLGLSERRADAVRDYLTNQGIPADRMDVAWKGKEDLRVPTPNGVREPQNRRVEIIIP